MGDTLKLWDQYTKLLANKSPQSLVSFLMPHAVFKHIVDRELQVPSLIADGLYEVVWRKKRIILHVEFQKWHDKNMARRMWQYNALVNMHTQLPVCSIVIYLKKHNRPVGSPYVIPLPDGRPTQRLDFETIKLWEIPSEFFEQQDFIGLLPLLPLTKDGKQEEKMERVIQVLREQDEKELLTLSYHFASLVFTKQRERQWLKGKFFEMKDLLSDTWVFQEIEKGGIEKGIEKGREEGEVQTLQRTLVEFVQVRFPVLTELAQRQAQLCKNAEALHTVTQQLYAAPDGGVAQSVLESLSEF